MNASKLQEDLTPVELEKLIKISKIVNSSSWDEVKHNKIKAKLLESDGFNDLICNFKTDNKEGNYSQFYFSDYEFWVEIWYYDYEYSLFVTYKEKREKILNYLYHTKWKKYHYYKKENNRFNYPDEESEEKLVEQLKETLLKSRK